MSKTRTITPNPPADFVPSKNDVSYLRPFRVWCQKVLPLVYDDSLSYYELLCKVVDYLNKTMEEVNQLGVDVSNLFNAFQQLQDYVNHYFDNLDVQEEINNKLDQMVEDGTFEEIFGGKVILWNNGISQMPKLTAEKILDKPFGDDEICQGFTTDGTYYYIYHYNDTQTHGFIGVFDTTTLQMVKDVDIYSKPHGNSLEYYDGKLYLACSGGTPPAGVDATHSVLVFDAVNITYLGAMTFATGVASFGICDVTDGTFAGKTACFVYSGNTSMISVYTLVGENLIPIHTSKMNKRLIGYNQGCRFSQGLIYLVNSTHSSNVNCLTLLDGNGCDIFTVYFTGFTSGNQTEIEDIAKTSGSNIMYIMDAIGSIYKVDDEGLLDISFISTQIGDYDIYNHRNLIYNKTYKTGSKNKVLVSVDCGERNNNILDFCSGTARIGVRNFPITCDEKCNVYTLWSVWFSYETEAVYVYNCECQYTWQNNKLNLTSFAIRKVNLTTGEQTYINDVDAYIESNDFGPNLNIDILKLIVSSGISQFSSPVKLI